MLSIIYYIIIIIVNEGTIVELYLTSMGRNYLGQLVGQCIPTTSPVYAYWTHLLPWLLNKMIQRLYPLDIIE